MISKLCPVKSCVFVVEALFLIHNHITHSHRLTQEIPDTGGLHKPVHTKPFFFSVPSSALYWCVEEKQVWMSHPRGSREFGTTGSVKHHRTCGHIQIRLQPLRFSTLQRCFNNPMNCSSDFHLFTSTLMIFLKFCTNELVEYSCCAFRITKVNKHNTTTLKVQTEFRKRWDVFFFFL